MAPRTALGLGQEDPSLVRDCRPLASVPCLEVWDAHPWEALSFSGPDNLQALPCTWALGTWQGQSRPGPEGSQAWPGDRLLSSQGRKG